MAATLVATSEVGNVPPRVRLDVTLPAGSVGVSVYITRVGPDGRTVPVRLADPALVAGSAWVGYDYEAPYGANVAYSAQVEYYASGARSNLCKNPSFEVDTAGWHNSPATYDEGCNHVRDPAQAWVGSASVRLDTVIDTGYIWRGATLASPGQIWTASAYVRGAGTAQIELIANGPGTTVVASSGTVTLTGAWQRISVTGTLPAGTTSTYYKVWQRSSAPKSLWVDGVLWEQSGSAGVYFDGDTPDGAVTYAWAGTPHASTSTSAATASSTTTETPTGAALMAVVDVWLVHPGVPDLSMRLDSVKSLGDRTRPVNRGIFTPFGRTMPLIATDGKRKAPQSQLVIRTRTLAELVALQALTEDAATLLLNVPEALGWGQGAEYISLGDLVESRPVEIGDDPERLVSGPYQVTSRPIGGSQSQRTWVDLMAECATWQEVMDRYDTWADALAPTT